MSKSHITRREALRAAALLGATTLLLDLDASGAAPAPGKTPPLSVAEIAAIEAALGKKGNYVEAQATHTTPLPRNDLRVSINGEVVPTALGFGGWVSVKKTLDGKSAVLMSDTVLLQEEVNPLISMAQANGLEIGAIHNHFFYEEPRIFYMHIHGMGSVEELARKYAATIKASKLFPANQLPPGPAPAQTGQQLFDVPALDAIVKYTGAVNGPTYKYTVGRSDLRVVAMGAEMTAAIGLNSWAAFAGSRDNAHVAGDIAMLEAEVNLVIRALRAHNLEVVAVHNHMLSDSPHVMFLHYYGRGPATDLAKGFRAALDQLGKPNTGTHMAH